MKRVGRHPRSYVVGMDSVQQCVCPLVLGLPCHVGLRSKTGGLLRIDEAAQEDQGRNGRAMRNERKEATLKGTLILTEVRNGRVTREKNKY